MNNKHEEAADLLAELNPAQVQALLLQRRIHKAHTAELAKRHPMQDFKLPGNEWADLKAHIMDGGGVEVDDDLARELLQAVVDDDQETFWDGVIHLVKARAKINGRMRQLPNGGVSMTGVGWPSSKKGKPHDGR